MFQHILPLDEVKNYLRIDSDFIEDDFAIIRMTASALEFITQVTNHVFKVQDKVYRTSYNRKINVYDHPINNIPTGRTPLYATGVVRFTGSDITLNVGYVNRYDVPSPLIDCALQLIKVWYFEAEKQSNTTLLPENVSEVLNAYRRAIAF